MRNYLVPAVLALGTTLTPIAMGTAEKATGTLGLRATVRFVSTPASRLAGVPEFVVCHARTGTGFIAGLGRVTET